MFLTTPSVVAMWILFNLTSTAAAHEATFGVFNPLPLATLRR
jgi:hypothetical protein